MFNVLIGLGSPPNTKGYEAGGILSRSTHKSGSVDGWYEIDASFDVTVAHL